MSDVERRYLEALESASDINRYRILSLLKDNPTLSLKSIARTLGWSRQMTYHHLERLMEKRLIQSREVGNLKIYSLTEYGRKILDVINGNKPTIIVEMGREEKKVRKTSSIVEMIVPTGIFLYSLLAGFLENKTLYPLGGLLIAIISWYVLRRIL